MFWSTQMKYRSICCPAASELVFLANRQKHDIHMDLCNVKSAYYTRFMIISALNGPCLTRRATIRGDIQESTHLSNHYRVGLLVYSFTQMTAQDVQGLPTLKWHFARGTVAGHGCARQNVHVHCHPTIAQITSAYSIIVETAAICVRLLIPIPMQKTPPLPRTIVVNTVCFATF